MRNLNKQRQENTEVEKQRFRHVLLHRDGQVSRWKSSSIAESMQTWAQLPKNVAICDIEACNLGRSISHLNVFEIAIANANGQWIIPPTIINYEITKRELFEANAGTLVNNLVFSKFYGDANETEARGNGKRTATWKGLGQELESYIANEGPIVEWFEWSSYNIDWQGVYAGLVAVGVGVGESDVELVRCENSEVIDGVASVSCLRHPSFSLHFASSFSRSESPAPAL
jgi:hypothetical protein